jgi:hypothetical protein
MGTLDNDDGLLIVDDVSHVRDGSVSIARRVFEGYWYRSVYWGVRPTTVDPQRTTVGLAEDTLFLEWRPDWAPGGKLGSDEMAEFISGDHDGSFQASVFMGSRQTPDGVYHMLLPELFVPVSLSSPSTTRLISVRKAPSRRLALTWLFDQSLEVHVRFAQASERTFMRLRSETLLNNAPREQHILGSHQLKDQLLALPSNPEAWQVLTTILGAAAHH